MPKRLCSCIPLTNMVNCSVSFLLSVSIDINWYDVVFLFHFMPLSLYIRNCSFYSLYKNVPLRLLLHYLITRYWQEVPYYKIYIANQIHAELKHEFFISFLRWRGILITQWEFHFKTLCRCHRDAFDFLCNCILWTCK